MKNEIINCTASFLLKKAYPITTIKYRRSLRNVASINFERIK